MAKKLEFYEGEEAQRRFTAGMKKILSYKPPSKKSAKPSATPQSQSPKQ